MSIKDTNKRIQITISKELLDDIKKMAMSLDITVSTLIGIKMREEVRKYGLDEDKYRL